VCVRSHGDPERTGKTKVGKLEIVVFINQKILRLKIAVKDAMRVAV
jgi:hypothetical protein